MATSLSPALPDPELELSWEGCALHVTHRSNSNGRRIMFLSDHGGPQVLESWMKSQFGGHGLWGCIELAQRGYHVIMPRVSPFQKRRGFKHLMSDFEASWKVAHNLGPNDIIFCVHNLLWWAPLLHRLRFVKAKIVTMLFAKEPLSMASEHAGIIGMTRVATEHGMQLNPKARHAHIPWGVQLTPHHHRLLPYEPKWGLSSGVTNRDFSGVAAAYSDFSFPLKICSRGAAIPRMPLNVEVMTKRITPERLVDELYRYAAYVLIYLRPDPDNREALGCKNLLESMALGRPVIKTRGGSMDGDIDIEKEGFGIYVNGGDPDDLRRAVRTIVAEPAMGAAMGLRGRELLEKEYTMERFANKLHTFFETL